MDIGLTNILITFVGISILYLARTIRKRNTSVNGEQFMSMHENQLNNGHNQEYTVVYMPEPKNEVDEILLSYDKELDDISNKLETFPSGLTIDERRTLESRYNEIIGLMVNRFEEKSQKSEFSDRLSSLKKTTKGDNNAN
jgi:hypothetical protein